MKKLKEFLGDFLAVLFWILLIYCEVFGIIHSARKHSGGDVLVAIALPPWAAYRSIEMWFHNDFSGVNWNKRLLSDSRTSIYFLSHAASQYDQFQINKEIEEFSAKIEKYPKDKKDYLQKVSIKFIEYLKSYTSDIINGLDEFRRTQIFKVVQSAKTLQLESELINYNLSEEIKNAKSAISAMEEMYKSDEGKSSSDNDELKAKFDTVMKLWWDKQDSDLKTLYKSIFNESLQLENNSQAKKTDLVSEVLYQDHGMQILSLLDYTKINYIRPF